jgi:PHD/YefM family antitoxin component YafN of YafNO toxin-antitoxin module
MKMLAIETNNPTLTTLVDIASEEPVIITRDNKPAFAFVAVSEEDIQTWLLGQNEDFLALMRRSWDRLHTEGGIPLAEVRQRLLTGS